MSQFFFNEVGNDDRVGKVHYREVEVIWDFKLSGILGKHNTKLFPCLLTKGLILKIEIYLCIY